MKIRIVKRHRKDRDLKIQSAFFPEYWEEGGIFRRAKWKPFLEEAFVGNYPEDYSVFRERFFSTQLGAEKFLDAVTAPVPSDEEIYP